MRLLRLLLAVLLSIALPFTNVAAAAMVHCAQPATATEAVMAMPADGADMHAHHHQMQDEGKAGDTSQMPSADGGGGCDHCSYCQSCVSMFFAPQNHDVVQSKPVSAAQIWVAEVLPQSVLEQLYRPPRFAFA